MATALRTESSVSNLYQIGNDYLNFLDDAGKTSEGLLGKDISNLCDDCCEKVVNEETIFRTRDAFLRQLLEAHGTFGTWKINPSRRVIPSEETRTVTVKYTAETEKGNLLAMAILTVNEKNLITKIDEVYCPLKSGEKV